MSLLQDLQRTPIFVQPATRSARAWRPFINETEVSPAQMPVSCEWSIDGTFAISRDSSFALPETRTTGKVYTVRLRANVGDVKWVTLTDLGGRAATWLEQSYSPSILDYLERVYPRDVIVRLIKQRKSRDAESESSPS